MREVVVFVDELGVTQSVLHRVPLKILRGLLWVRQPDCYQGVVMLPTDALKGGRAAGSGDVPDGAVLYLDGYFGTGDTPLRGIPPA